MRRRRFLETMAVGALGAATGCATSVTRAPDDGGATTIANDAPIGHDATLTAVDAAPVDVDTSVFVITSAFLVQLHDTSCSGHDHDCLVEPASYADDAPVSFNGPGSHQVAFRPSELVRLQAGESLPFATIGPGPGHGHCGLAWRGDAPSPARGQLDACDIATPAGMTPAICAVRPRA
jgi:hypothetical protein